TLGAIFTPASAMSCSHPGQAPHGSWATQTIPRWLRGQTITRYRSDQPDSFTCEFEAPFARLEYVSRDRFDLSYHRHTGEWYFQASFATLPPTAGRGRRKTQGNRSISCTRIRSGDSPNSMSVAQQLAQTSTRARRGRRLSERPCDRMGGPVTRRPQTNGDTRHEGRHP